MKTKFGVFNNLKIFNVFVKNQNFKCIKVIECDANREYNFKNFNGFFKENGIVKQTIILYVLEQNGVGERNN